jgi:8-amino-7-oxononanoate synthase
VKGSTRALLNEQLAQASRELEAQGLARSLDPVEGLDLESNDYLGWAKDPAFRKAVSEKVAQWAASPSARFAPGSRLLGGETPLHRTLEARLASWLREDAALVFPSGWQASCALVSALVEPADRVISDAWNHASWIDAIRLSRASKVVVPHLDLDAYRRALETPHSGGKTLVVVESVYSMDGDLAPLYELFELTEKFGALLLVDEAHATGLYGARGTGRVEESGLEGKLAARLLTFGKALALQGAAIAGSRELMHWIVQRARPFLFSTAVTPLLLLGLEVALDRLEAFPTVGYRARQLAGRLRSGLERLGYGCRADDSPIVPLLLGTNQRALRVAGGLRERGFSVRAVRPPTVPEGTSRIRFSVHVDHREEDLERLLSALKEVDR